MKNGIEKMMHSTCGVIHFIGIGGIGISGIAEILHNLGYKVQGSDLSSNSNVERLQKKGIQIFIGHNVNNINNASVIVKSSAAKDVNIEIIAAKAKKIPIIRRSEMLAELMRLKISVAISGAHGKTTTTSLMAEMFENMSLNPTVINGGIINARGTNAYIGSGDYLIVEADESDGTFIKVPSTIGIVTNIDPEHLDYYHDFESLKKAYKTFIENLPFYGFAVCCVDHPVVLEVIENIEDRQIITYAIDNKHANVRAENIQQTDKGFTFDVHISEIAKLPDKIFISINLPMRGIHNILNSLAAIAVAYRLGFSEEIIKTGFDNFQGVKRRFTEVFTGKDLMLVDDYAVHPEEIKVTLKTAKSVAKDGRVIAVIQPHRYTRLHNLFSEFTHCFEDADVVIIADVYSAGERAIEGVSRDVLVSAIKQEYPHKIIYSAAGLHEVEGVLREELGKYENQFNLVLYMGAGDITKWSYNFSDKLKNATNC